MKREPLMDESYFENSMAYKSQRIPEMQKKLAAAPFPARNKAVYAYSLFREQYEYLVLRYSAGNDIRNLIPSMMDIMGSWESSHALALQGYEIKDRASKPTFAVSEESYVVPLWLISLGVLLRINDDMFKRLLMSADGEQRISNEGQDLLFERLVASRMPGRKSAKRLLYPKAYQPLYDAIDASGPDKDRLMKTFLAKWYTSLRDCYWHENHTGPDGGGFFGYWAIEAAGVVAAFDIEDAAFRDMPYYPKDLVNFYRDPK